MVTTPNLASWFDRLLLLFGVQPFSTEVSFAERSFGKKLLYKVFGKDKSIPVGHLRLFTYNSLKDMGEYYGFKVIDRYGAYQQPFLLNIIISKMFKGLAEDMIVVFLNDN